MKIAIKDIGDTRADKTYVTCKKSIKNFKKGNEYAISGFYGDPEGSIVSGEEFMTTDFLNVIVVEDVYFDNSKRNSHYAKYNSIGIFQDHFYLNKREVRKEKLRNIKD